MKRLELCSSLTTLLVLGMAGCDSGSDLDFSGLGGSGSGPTGFTIDLTGTWTGTWTSSTGSSGTFSSTFDQSVPTQGGGSPAAVAGSAVFDGAPCSVPFSVVATVIPGGFVSATSLHGIFTDGSETIDFSTIVTVDSNSITGQYEVLAGSACAGDTGTLMATRTVTVPATIPVMVRMQTEIVHANQSQGFAVVLIEDSLDGRVVKRAIARAQRD